MFICIIFSTRSYVGQPGYGAPGGQAGYGAPGMLGYPSAGYGAPGPYTPPQPSSAPYTPSVPYARSCLMCLFRLRRLG